MLAMSASFFRPRYQPVGKDPLNMACSIALGLTPIILQILSSPKALTNVRISFFMQLLILRCVVLIKAQFVIMIFFIKMPN